MLCMCCTAGNMRCLRRLKMPELMLMPELSSWTPAWLGLQTTTDICWRSLGRLGRKGTAKVRFEWHI
jgi:hypothetical protein